MTFQTRMKREPVADVSQKCLSLHNFSSMWAILAGLNSSTIMRLKKTWDVSLRLFYHASLSR